MRCWGNCAVDQQPVIETPTSYIFSAVFIDLEAGTSLSRQFRQSRSWRVYGRMDEFRKEDVRFQIGQSKATRNVIISALPRWLIDQGLERAKAGVMKKLDSYIAKHGIAAARKLALSELRKLGATENRVFHRLEIEREEQLTKEYMVTLQGDIKALRAGEESAQSLFPPIEGKEEEKPSGAGPNSAAKEKVRQAAAKAGEGTGAAPAPANNPDSLKESKPEPESGSVPDADVPKVTTEQMQELRVVAGRSGRTPELEQFIGNYGELLPVGVWSTLMENWKPKQAPR